MPDNYIYSYVPAEWQQSTPAQIQQRMGLKPLTEELKRITDAVIANIDNPGLREQQHNAKRAQQLRDMHIVETNPGLKPMGEVIDPRTVYFVPVLGDAALAGEAVYNTATGNYKNAALNIALLAGPSAVAGGVKAYKTAKAIDGIADLSKLSKAEAKQIYDKLMQQLSALLQKLKEAEAVRPVPGAATWQEKMHHNQSGSWLGGKITTTAPDYTAKEIAMQQIRDQINVVNKQIRDLSAAGHNFTGYTDDVVREIGAVPNSHTRLDRGEAIRSGKNAARTERSAQTAKEADLVVKESLNEPLTVYSGLTLDGAVGKGRPASNINPVTGKPITMLDVLDAMGNNGRTVYEGTSESAIKSAAVRSAADSRAKYLQVLDALDRKANKVKQSWEASPLNWTKSRAGKAITSDKAKITTYLEEELAGNFTPSLKAVKSKDWDIYYPEWLKYLDDLGYDVVTKESLDAANKIALNTWGRSLPVKKQGGILNYSTYFS